MINHVNTPSTINFSISHLFTSKNKFATELERTKQMRTRDLGCRDYSDKRFFVVHA